MPAWMIKTSNALVARVGRQFVNGNNILGGLVADCCSDVSRGGQGYTDDDTCLVGAIDPNTGNVIAGCDSNGGIQSLIPGTPVSTAVVSSPAGSTTGSSQTAAAPPPSYALTPVDLITGTKGFQLSRSSAPWPRRPILGRAPVSRNYPDYGPMASATSMMPRCPCFSQAPPIVVAAPVIVTPAPASAPAPAPAPASPAPAAVNCRTSNVCMDLANACIAVTQVSDAQVQACASAGYGLFGSRDVWRANLSLLQQMGPLPYYGDVNLDPPPAAASMQQWGVPGSNIPSGFAPGPYVPTPYLTAGMSGLGQDDSSNVGGFLAVVAMFGIVVWAMKK